MDTKRLIELAKLLGWLDSQGNTTEIIPEQLSRRGLDWIETGDGMVAVLERMRDLGWMYYLGDFGNLHRAIFHRKDCATPSTVESQAADTIPSAVALAAYAALGGGRK